MPLRPPSSSLSASILPRRVLKFDRRAGRTINALATSARADGLLLALSTSANKGVLWFAAAAALALESPTGRRAAIRGVLSLVGASAFANLVAKPVFGGSRPSADDIPLRRQLRHFPESASFPSGHTASALAFATGVALESPRRAAVIAPMALGVAYSRLHVGAHWFSDVAGGVAIGVGIAVVGKLLVPGRTGDGPIEPAGPLTELPILEAGRGLFVATAAVTGERRSAQRRRRDLAGIIRELPLAQVHLLLPGDDPGRVFREAVATAEVVAIGVDEDSGALSAAASVAAESGLPLFVLPRRAPGPFTTALRLANTQAALQALHEGTGVIVDLAQVQTGALGDGAPGRSITDSLSIGLYADIVTERDRLTGSLGRVGASIVATARILRRAAPLDLEVNGTHRRVWSVFVGVGRYGVGQVVPRARRGLDAGLLDVRVISARSARERIDDISRGLVALPLGDLAARRALRRAAFGMSGAVLPEVTITVPAGQHHAEDGRVAPGHNDGAGYGLTVTTQPGSLRVYAPWG